MGLRTSFVDTSQTPAPGSPAIYLLGMNPGVDEDRSGLPFVGRSGQCLRNVYIRNVLDNIASLYIGNAVRCWTPLDAQPKGTHYDACWTWTMQDLETVYALHQCPVRILCLGLPASKAALKNLTSSKQRSFSHLQRSQGIPSTCDRYKLYFTFHPAAVIRKQGAQLLHAVSDHLAVLEAAVSGTRPTPSRPLLVPPRSPQP